MSSSVNSDVDPNDPLQNQMVYLNLDSAHQRESANAAAASSAANEIASADLQKRILDEQILAQEIVDQQLSQQIGSPSSSPSTAKKLILMNRVASGNLPPPNIAPLEGSEDSQDVESK